MRSRKGSERGVRRQWKVEERRRNGGRVGAPFGHIVHPVPNHQPAVVLAGVLADLTAQQPPARLSLC